MKMTDPIINILPKNEIDPALQDLLNKFSLGLEEVVNFGTHIHSWDIQEAKGGVENIPISLMFRNILDLLDSVSILVKQSSIDPCKLILRSLLETFLGLEYLLENDTRNRSLGFLVWHYFKDLKQHKKFDPSDNSSVQLQNILKDDKSLSGLKLPNFSTVERALLNIDKLLADPIYNEAKTSYLELISKKETNPNWYRLFNGPKNIEQLAKYLKRQGMYEVLYRNWSGPTHGTDILLNKLGRKEDGMVEYFQIRYPKDAQAITQLSFSLALLSFQLMIEKRLKNKEKDYWTWYLSVREFYLKITKEKLLSIE